VRRAAGKLSIDVEWYLEAQIHPPVNRLCAHIEGTSSPQLAHCLGLDTSKFSHAATHLEDQDGADAIPSVLQSDAERFKACAPLELACRRCQRVSAFPGVYRIHGADGSPPVSGLRCPEADCGADLWGYDQEGVYGNVGDDLVCVLSNRLHLATRASTAKYYEGWAVCSDVTCKTRSQKQSLRGNGNICAAPDCRAVVHMEFPDAALYTQLRFFESLFDVPRARTKLAEQQARGGGGGAASDANAGLPALPETHVQVFKRLHKQARRAVQLDAYNWVKPSVWQTLFTDANS
jgi:DNA polymerase alpha subunit A